ncbi:MAG TPA: hypothetical protein VFJ47_12195 [Terriglobales bacterium]|nr:hypothetical protein [Terriglobales bacterium]
MRRRWFLIGPLAIVATVLFIAVGGVIVQQLWNWLLPALFGWHHISFWQAVGLLALCRILFGRLGGRGFYRSNFRRRMAERWESMTPEERERFQQGMRGRCGWGRPAAETKEQPGGI